MPALLVSLGLASAGVGGWYWLAPRWRAQRLFASAVESSLLGNAEAAQRQAWDAWTADPRLDEAAMLAAEMAYRRERFDEAVQCASRVGDSDPKLKLAALRLSALLYHRELHLLSDAEKAYRAALAIDPDEVECNAGLANLLGLCARRADAIPLVLRLIRLGQASDLLMLLARDDAAVNDLPALEAARRAAPDDALPCVGLAWHAAESGHDQRAIELLEQAIQLDSELACARVALAKIYSATGRFEELRRSEQAMGKVAQRAEQYADLWLARGALAEHDGDLPGAVRCYAEAAKRAPDSKTANARLAQLLNQVDQSAIAARFEQYAAGLQQLRDAQEQVFFSRKAQGTEPMLELIGRYDAVGRLWEAYGWAQIAMQVDAAPQIKQLFQTLAHRTRGAPLQLVQPDQMPVHALDLARYPLPARRAKPSASDANLAESSPVTHFAFRDEAESAHLEFHFHNGTDGQTHRKMYEFTGGGIAVLDFDADGWPDVACTQGTRWPPGASSEFRDKLFRNIGGERFEEVPSFQLDSDGFGQGATVGDYDADGFPDLYIAQIGQNRLLHNNGDGTFSDVTQSVQIAAEAWTTSCVMADLNGDSLPDLYDVNYVQGQDVFERVCTDAGGQAVMCMPGDFDAAADYLWINDGQGAFRDGTQTELSVPPVGKGLGAAVMDADGSGHLSLFVANDTTPNFWFVPEKQSDGRVALQEEGIASGLAFNVDGKAQGCMGVAVADVNEDGQMDMLVTNFYQEASTLYVAQGNGQFADQTRAWGLREPSLNMLGFGTQFFDADLDGKPELFVANGHVDDVTHRHTPYEMEPQFFALRGNRFQLVPPSPERPYFQRKLLGRAVAKLDWNRDGREDLLVGHLHSKYALLTNATHSSGKHVTLCLVGTRSNRDAIGTRVEVHCSGRRLAGQLTAGDGYQASNERHLVFGLGRAEQADRIVIHWPSGAEQELHSVPAGEEVLVVERR
ncbi:MAG: FG-GAP-like repeat-containing protein [Aureliella sp.]